MIKLTIYETYNDVFGGFWTTQIYNDWEYKNIIEDMLKSNAAAFSIRKTS